MTGAPRKASLRVAHSRACPHANLSALGSLQGCRCKPSYHTFYRGPDGRPVKGKRVRDRQTAERALRRLQVRLDEGTLEQEPRPVAFATWAEEWLHGLDGKQTSSRAYASTIAYATGVFGRTAVRDLRAADVRRFLDLVRACNRERGREVSPATLAKHLRQLGACLQAALSEGHARENPVRALHKTFKPKVRRPEPSYFTDAELARLWPALTDPQLLHLCKLAVATGMRQGELLGLEWGDVSLAVREIHVRRTYAEGIGTTAPKSGKPRTVDLTPQAAELLDGWRAIAASREPGALVFSDQGGGHLRGQQITRSVLYPALGRAGIARAGERGRERTFHSFRHTFARIALENGAEITWVQRQLGHSSITLTVDSYGSWERRAEKVQAQRLAGAFPV